jgi:PKD repeat protein
MHFTATVTGTTPITYSWDFDNDGTPEQSGTDLDIVSHTYSSGDTYTVTLDVENECSTDTHSITVTVNPVPCEDVSIDDLTSDSPVTLGDPMHFTATVTGTTPITYSWDFDSDGTPEQSGTDLDIISHTYSSADTYTVTLDVENECSTDSHSTEVTVNGHNIYLPLVLRNHQ